MVVTANVDKSDHSMLRNCKPAKSGKEQDSDITFLEFAHESHNVEVTVLCFARFRDVSRRDSATFRAIS